MLSKNSLKISQDCFECTYCSKAKYAKDRDIFVNCRLINEGYKEEMELNLRPILPLQSRSGVGMIRPGELKEIKLPGGWFEGTGQYQFQASGRRAISLGANLTEKSADSLANSLNVST